MVPAQIAVSNGQGAAGLVLGLPGLPHCWAPVLGAFLAVLAVILGASASPDAARAAPRAPLVAGESMAVSASESW
jgi:hypothetical protein